MSGCFCVLVFWQNLLTNMACGGIISKKICWCGSMAEQRYRKPQVAGSTPVTSSSREPRHALRVTGSLLFYSVISQTILTHCEHSRHRQSLFFDETEVQRDFGFVVSIIRVLKTKIKIKLARKWVRAVPVESLDTHYRLSAFFIQLFSISFLAQKYD